MFKCQQISYQHIWLRIWKVLAVTCDLIPIHFPFRKTSSNQVDFPLPFPQLSGVKLIKSWVMFHMSQNRILNLDLWVSSEIIFWQLRPQCRWQTWRYKYSWEKRPSYCLVLTQWATMKIFFFVLLGTVGESFKLMNLQESEL